MNKTKLLKGQICKYVKNNQALGKEYVKRKKYVKESFTYFFDLMKRPKNGQYVNT